jgi:uncharacterized integral membrane protein
MKILGNFLNSLLIAGWVSAIAIFSIQNIQPVSLQFFNWQSIQLPIGVLLAFCVAIGMILGSVLPLLWKEKKQSNSRSY